MKRTLAVLCLVIALSACNKKPDNCIDPNTFENRCVEQQISEVDQVPSTVTTDNSSTTYQSYPQVHNNYTTYREHDTVIVREKPKPSIIPPAVGGMIGAWLGKKFGEKREAPSVTVVQPKPVQPMPPAPRQIPIVPNSKPYVPPPRPAYVAPKPTYTAPSRPSYSAPATRPMVPSSRK